MNIVLLGPPGAGKGTQALRIAKTYDIPHISTGEIFRRAVADETEMGMRAKAYMNRGELVPDEVVIGIVKERLEGPDCAEGFLLDGFPRTVAQAEALEKELSKSGRELDSGLDIEVGRASLIKRLTGRRTCRACGKVYHLTFDPPQSATTCDACGGELWQRDDDTEETVSKRLDVYEEQTAPLIDFYNERDLLVEVDGERGVDDVFSAVKQLLTA